MNIAPVVNGKNFDTPNHAVAYYRQWEEKSFKVMVSEVVHYFYTYKGFKAVYRHGMKSVVMDNVSIAALCHWQDPSYQAPEPGSSVADAFHLQNAIGWWPFLQGHMSLEWASAQNDFLVNIGRSNAGHQWISQLIKKVFLISWDMWDCCNHALHHRSSASRQRLVAELSATIRRLHSTNPSDLLPQDQYHLEEPISMLQSSEEGWASIDTFGVGGQVLRSLCSWFWDAGPVGLA